MRRRTFPAVFVICLCAAALSCAGVPARKEAPAAKVRPGSVLKDQSYGIFPEQKFDLYCPPGNGPWPLVVFIHGGAWSSGERGEAAPFAFLAGRGVALASIDYRRYPAYRFPAMIEDAKLAVRYLRANAARLRLDGTRIAAMGHSAGGHLAALLASADESVGWDRGDNLGVSSAVCAAVDLSGPAALDNPGNGWLLGTSESVFAGPGDPIARLRSASPSFLARRYSFHGKGPAPLLIVHGDADPVVPYLNALALEEAWMAAGAEVRLVRVRGGDHLLLFPNNDPMPERVSFLLEKLGAR